MAYVYRGDKPNTEPTPATPAAPPAQRKAPVQRTRTGVFDPTKCGTHKGYKQHARYSVELCDPCRAANSEYHRQWRAANPTEPKTRPVGAYTPGICGDHNGYERHRRDGTIPCTECRAGHALYNAEWRDKQAARDAERNSTT